MIGSLLEKERTVPDSYPMTLNGLRIGLQPDLGRDPVTELDEGEIERSLDRLKADGFARLVHASHGARVVKYRQVLSEALDLGDGERAIVTLLLLRGPQTPGELRSRSERLHPFADLDAVDAALRALVGSLAGPGRGAAPPARPEGAALVSTCSAPSAATAGCTRARR